MAAQRRRSKKTSGRRTRLKDPFDSAHPIPYITRRVPVYELASEELLEIIENNAETVLEDIGIEFRDDEQALELFRSSGCRVEGNSVKFPRGMCREIIQNNAPSEFTQHARNPKRSVKIGGDSTVLVPAYGSPFVRDLDNGRRYATLEDFENFTKLTWMSPFLHHSGGTLCEPVDIPVNKRHLDMIYSHIRWSDKPFMGSVTAPERAQDTVNMAKIVFGESFLDDNCVITSLINANSPMTFDATMLAAARVYAENNQANVISPFILAGAMSPVTVVGTCTQLFAEALAGMTFVQLTKPGAPVIFGTFSSSISMQSGAPTFGSPEPSMVLYIAAALARRLGVPFRSGGGLCASKVADAQAAYESSNTLQTAMLAGVHFMLHTSGWLEGGLTMSYEKFILDTDQAGMIQVFLSGVDSSINGQAMSAIQEVGPGNHFLGCQHTQTNFESAFYRSAVADNTSFEQWRDDGEKDAEMRANKIWKDMLNTYEPPSIEPGVNEELLAYVKSKKDSLPDLNY
ncbi:MAG: trimethylamine methyltransferase [Acidiferrobacteraceae bacterium]|nr:trimethylamine methyltransferase [Acidiferrobacteraceae bacterium]